jgi:hypothetical protein
LSPFGIIVPLCPRINPNLVYFFDSESIPTYHNLQCQIIDKDHHTLMYGQFDDEERLYRLTKNVKALKKAHRAMSTKRKWKIRKEKRSCISTENYKFSMREKALIMIAIF